MSEPDTCDLAEAAAEAGCHYDTFRKSWRCWADPHDPRYIAFPPPFRHPPQSADGTRRRGTYAWRRSAIAAWKAHRERCGLPTEPQPRPLGRPPLAPGQTAHGFQLQRERAELARLMESA